jgi:hypothetical protein
MHGRARAQLASMAAGTPRASPVRRQLLEHRLGEHVWIAGTGHANFANVGGMMSSGNQQWTDSRREVLIDQEPHAGGLSG